MRLDPPLRVLAAATELPALRVPALEAVAAGALPAQDHDSSGIRALPVESTRSAPELAVCAARSALAAADRPAADVDLVVHSWTHYQGHDFWSPAHYVADQVGARGAHCLGVQQMCHGSAASLEIAASRMLADPGVRLALLTTADRFDDAWFDRWGGDYGVLYGDGGTACVVTRDDVPATVQLRSIVSASLPELEGLHRDTTGFADRPGTSRRIDVRATKKAYLQRHGSDALRARFGAALRDVVVQALDEAGVAPADVDAVVLPRVGADVVADMYEPALADVLPAHLVHQHADTGHLGAGDLFANLADAPVASLEGRVRLYVTAGGGFTVSATVAHRTDDQARTRS